VCRGLRKIRAPPSGSDGRRRAEAEARAGGRQPRCTAHDGRCCRRVPTGDACRVQPYGPAQIGLYQVGVSERTSFAARTAVSMPSATSWGASCSQTRRTVHPASRSRRSVSRSRQAWPATNRCCGAAACHASGSGARSSRRRTPRRAPARTRGPRVGAHPGWVRDRRGSAGRGGAPPSGPGAPRGCLVGVCAACDR
jgi:hypothetical protein